MDLVITYRDDPSPRVLVAADVTPELVEAYRRLLRRHDDKPIPLRHARQRWESGRYGLERDWLLDGDRIETIAVEYNATEAGAQPTPPAPVDRLKVERYGAHLRGTWLWPADVTLVEVTWVGPGNRVTTQLTRSGYVRNGHHVQTTQPACGQLVVTSLRATPSGVHRAADRIIAFTAEPLTLTYSLQRTRTLGPFSRYVLKVDANQPCADVHLQARIGLRDRTETGQVVATTENVTAGPDAPFYLPVPVPFRAGLTRRRQSVRCDAWTRHGEPITVDDLLSFDRLL